ncbi:MAG TPA: hypothetical protein P5531_04050 [Bacteroidales bacterium]|nr:hypothetical protein [Bacteroidales bacterium]
MTPSEFNFPNIYRGDTAPVITFEILDGNDEPIDLTEVKIKMDCVLRNGSLKHSFSEQSGIDINLPLEGKFDVSLGKITWVAGIYDYDMEFWFSGGTIIKTYVYGTITVLQDVTNK